MFITDVADVTLPSPRFRCFMLMLISPPYRRAIFAYTTLTFDATRRRCRYFTSFSDAAYGCRHHARHTVIDFHHLFDA